MFKVFPALAAVLLLAMASSVVANDLPLLLVPSISVQQQVDGSSIVVVDPYIFQASLFEDKNNNSVKDTGEQLSTFSDANGQCSFTAPLTLGSTLVAEAKGIHNGVPYEIALKREVTAGLTGTIIISPLTTLASDSLSNTQLATMLIQAGLTGVSASMISDDPMGTLATHTGAVTAPELVKIQASIASYVFMRIREGSNRLANMSGLELYASAMDKTTPGELNLILTKAVNIIKRSISETTVTQAQALIPNGLPELTVMDIIQAAVTIADRLAYIGHTTCNATLDENDPAGTAVGEVENVATDNISSWIDELGMRYYGYRNRAALATFSNLPQSIQDGANSDDGIWYITDANLVDALNPPQD